MKGTINSYNRDLLVLVESNMDLQFITDAYGTCGYVCNYQNKGQKGTVESGLLG